MKKVMSILSRLGLLALATGFMVVFSGCQKEDINVQSESLVIKSSATMTMASGQGTLVLEDTPINGEGFRHFTFQARVKPNGSVEGSGILTHIGGVRNISFDIDCLTVNGNHAIMSGVITRDNQSPPNEGILIYFVVFDNGEGANADPDQISVAYLGTNPATYNCANDYGVPSYEIVGGNIQVRE